MPAPVKSAEVPVAIEVAEPIVVQPTTKSARVKGTWTMFYGSGTYDFVDGHRYELPLSLYAYLRSSGNIYDTL